MDSADRGLWLITIAASAGGLSAVSAVIRSLPAGLPAALVVIQHRLPRAAPDHFKEILARAAMMPVLMADPGQHIEPGRIYIARSDFHLTISHERCFSYIDGTRIRFVQSSANPLFASAAAEFGRHLVAVVLTGTGSDASDGVQAVKAHGGLVIAQDPATAEYKGMPAAAIRSGAVDLVLPLDKIAPALVTIVSERPFPV